MAASRGYDFWLHKSGDAELKPQSSAVPEKWHVPKETQDEAIRAVMDSGFAQMRLSYTNSNVTDGGTANITLTTPELTKAVVADGGDPRSQPVWGLLDRLRRILGIDSVLTRRDEEWRAEAASRWSKPGR